MIASWMPYALVITALVSVAALIAERIAILRRLQGRWIWVSALLLSVLLPLVFAWARWTIKRDARDRTDGAGRT